MKKLLPFIIMLPLLMVTFTLTAQKQSSWTATSVDKTERLIPVKKQKDFNLQLEEIKSHLRQSGQQSKLSIPYPDGKFQTFNLKESQIMEPALAAKFPNIKVYVGRNPETGDNIRISVGKDGFHAMVFSKEGTFFIDPVSKKDNIKYQVYYKKDLDADLIDNEFYEEEPIIADKRKFEEVKRKVESGLVERPSGTELRTYRIAVATTGEYTQFHGGTVEDALSAIVTTMNRVNGIYEKDIAVTMVLVANNDELIYTDASTDPYTNNSAGAFISEVQTDITNIIGSDNFDIGHGFSTGAGGLASLGSVCVDSRKASGVTGRAQPIGDPYDVDYVAHEIGHQFGAPHTFNGVVGSCAGGNRSANSAYEPGSGTTIMAYAGICGSDDIQNNSDPYFHTASLDFMTVFSQTNAGNTCAETTSTGNNLPIVEAGQGGFTIPINTPFQLNGSATDPDGDGLTYAWEQFDLGPAGSPNSPVDNAPIFRSFEPTTDSFRIFPQLSDILNGTQTQGEILPSYTRDLNFRLTVRDDQQIAAVDYDELSFSVTDQAGPFVVEELTGDFSGLSTVTVNWQVNNTNIAPVNAEFVNIYISNDGGNSFTELVAQNTPNDGSEVITLPNINTSSAKIKVAASNNVFFNISPSLFSISETTDPTFTVAISNDSENYCPSDEVTFTISSESILDYSEPINLSIVPLGDFTETFDNVTINPGESTTLRLNNDTEVFGTFNLSLNANSGSISRSAEIPFTITNNPETPNITFPVDGATDLSLNPTIVWEDNNIESTYNIEIATDINFTNIVEPGSTTEKEYTIQNELAGNTTYYLRISTENSCGQSNFSTISFTTAEITCNEYFANDLPIAIDANSLNTIQSTINIGSTGILEGIELSNISGTHTYIQDLTFRLVSPSGTEVVLISNICGSEDDFSFSLSDDAASSTLPCPPNDGSTYQPESPLSTFLGEEIEGNWTLFVDDSFNQDGGELQNWGLSFCIGNFTEPEINRPTNLSSILNNDATITVNWTDNSDNEDGFIIERSEDSDNNFIEIATSNSNTNSFVDNVNLSVNSTYYYRIKATLGNFSSDYSDTTNVFFEGPQINAPSNLVLQENEFGQINLTWTDNSDNEDGFIIERSDEVNNNFVEIGSSGSNNNSFTDSNNLTINTTYYYRVKATFENFNSEYSAITNILFEGPEIIAPSNLTAQENEIGVIELTWTINSNNETNFSIERSTNDQSNFTEIGSVNMSINSFEDNTVEGETEYFYKVKAEQVDFSSDYSNVANILTQAQFPPAPTTIIASNNTDGSVLVQWTDNAEDEMGYILERSVDDNSDFTELAQLNANSFEYTDNSVEAETVYFYRVKAFNENGESDYSPEAQVETPLGFPAAPSNLSITIENDSVAQLTWFDNATNEISYLVQRSVGTSSFQQIADLEPNSQEFEEILEEGTYTYRIAAVNSRGRSDFSNEVTVEIIIEEEEILNNLEAWSSKVLMFPNPAKDIVYIKNESNAEIITVQIRNTLGQIIQNVLISDHGNQIEIPIQSFTKGLYLLHIESNHGSIRKQLIIE